MNDTDGRSVRHVSSFQLELARAGVASEAEGSFVGDHLRRCPACSEMAATFEAARGELAGPTAARVRARLNERLEGGRRRRFHWLGVSLLVPAAAAVVAVVAMRRPPNAVDAGPEIGIKGGTGFLVAARRGARVFPVRPGEPLRAGDQIRFVLERVRHPYLLIASVDGGGHANVYVPYEGSASLRIGAGERIEIPGSIIIDDSPGPERLFAFLSERPVNAAAVRAALAAVGAGGVSAIRGVTRLDVEADEQLSLLVEKASP